MNREQFLLMKIAEEASEVAQAALKAMQFGMDEKAPHLDKTNKERLKSELTDLIGVIDMLNEECDFGMEEVDEKAIEEKINRVNHYYEYSKNCGMIHETQGRI